MTASWQQALDRLKTSGGRRFWRGLDELLDTPGFRRALADEFPSLQDGPLDWERRDVLRCLGASLALSGLAGCQAQPDERSMPYVNAPEDMIPGKMRGYATAVTFAGYAHPVIGMTNVGRPTKLEGNPDHPMSGGATDAFTQAALLDLYDPDRSRALSFAGRPSSWEALDKALAAQAVRLDATGGAGFALLTGAISSPTMLRQIDILRARWPAARWFVDEWDMRDHRGAATALAFGRPLDRIARFDVAQATVIFDDDPLGPGPAMVANSLGWASRRRAFQRGDGAATWMVAEPSPTLTGGRADRRLIAGPSRIPALVEALAALFGIDGARRVALVSSEQVWIERAGKALAAAKGKGLVLVGREQPPEIQALGFAIDERLGNLAATSRFVSPVRRFPDGDGTLDALLAGIDAGSIKSLVVIDANPVQLPMTRPVQAGLAKLDFSLHAGTHCDETGLACTWHVPLAHDLESWSDGRAIDGTPVIIQPLVRPFFDVRGRHALMAALARAGGDDHAIVRKTWAGVDDKGWEQALVSGSIGVADDGIGVGPVRKVAANAPPVSRLSLLVRADPTLWDGRFANNPWAQEQPKPFTTLTWGNAALIAPRFAAERGLVNGDVVRLSRGGGAIEAPVWIMPGQAPGTILIHIGHGRAAGGTVAEGSGFDALLPIGSGPLTIAPTGKRQGLAATQQHHAIDGHDLVRTTPLDDRAPAPPEKKVASFYADKLLTSPNWGMAIDLDLCTGCGACVTACVAENNIPMVGRDQVARGRDMHWLRVDRYYEGDPDAPLLHNQPIPCMHCEDAPCEMGCPVNAAVHSPEGLNLQVYNRCIGTRTCSSYCPYKVRRFNWYDFTGDRPESIQAQRNPNVTVRARGVMEKCTYCIQRISGARIDAKEAGHPIADGAVKTACQQVCPTGAISFGNIADPQANVVHRKALARNYTLLDEANTRPRTSYLARIREDEA